ncbi:MAG: DHH family phosphoesterase [bacterium]
MTSEKFSVVLDIINRHSDIIVTSHIDPDGDAIGCVLAFHLFLKRLGKSSKALLEDGIDDNYRFLEGSAEVLSSIDHSSGAAIILDSASIERVGRLKSLVEKCQMKINIDHHRSNQMFGDYNLVIADAGACAEIVYRLIEASGRPISRSEAEALYVGILSDTGCFRFPNTTPESLRIASELLKAGVKPYRVASEIFWNRSPRGVLLLSNALSTIEVADGGEVASMVVTREMIEATGADNRDTEGFADYPRSIRNVKVGILLREIGHNLYRVSLRSREGFDVDGIARAFGGGGHPTAAGFRICGELSQLKKALHKEIEEKVLRRSRSADE